MFDGNALEVIAFAQATVVVDQEFRHQEQRNTLHPVGGVGQTGQDHVDDVVGQVMLAVGNEYFLAADAVVIAVAFGLRLDPREIRTGLRFSQVHGAVPLPGNQFFKIRRLEFVRAMGGQQFDRALGQKRAQGEGHVGRIPQFGYRRGDQPRQALAAEFRVEGDAVPATIDKLPVGVFKSFGAAHDAVLEAAAFDIA